MPKYGGAMAPPAAPPGTTGTTGACINKPQAGLAPDSLVACKLQQQEDCKTASHCKLRQDMLVLVWHGIPWVSQNCVETTLHETVERARPKWRKGRTGRQLQWPICRKIRAGDKYQLKTKYAIRHMYYRNLQKTS